MQGIIRRGGDTYPLGVFSQQTDFGKVQMGEFPMPEK
jgi:hypothetical protein